MKLNTYNRLSFNISITSSNFIRRLLKRPSVVISGICDLDRIFSTVSAAEESDFFFFNSCSRIKFIRVIRVSARITLESLGVSESEKNYVM